MTQRRPSDDDISFINDAKVASLLDASHTGRWIIWSTLVFLLIASLWAHYSKLDTVTTGQGKVIPSSQRQIVQNLEGGLVKQIFIQEGDRIQAGDRLMEIDDTRFLADVREQSHQQQDLQAQAVRLQAQINSVLIQDADNNDGDASNDIAINAIALQFPEAILGTTLEAQHRAQYNQDLINLRTQLRQLEQQVNQRRQELREARSRAANLKMGYQLAKEEYNLTKPLGDEGVVSQVEILKLERQTNDALRELQSAELQLPVLSSSLAETILRRNEIAMTFRAERQAELNQVSAELGAMSERAVGLQDKVERTLVRSPVNGIIQKLHINTIGGVIQPGADLVEIVPDDDRLMIEAKIAPQDIAFLRPGLPSIVKFSAYDFTRYGGLTGTLEHISADTTTDEEGNAFYLVRVLTESNHLAKDDGNSIIPGMTATVDIISGQRTILDYITKPVRTAASTALREL
ncbi:HlyD family type I secretion periplasmic adaptor subunit [Ferrimonas pelagia]|uniref:Membrane fusion protein (MFP) family protein n=1 Tax=Ferrimonas pelagia TaxID=1177826 RepID=A0ABP9F8J3_9GAMM